MFLLQDFKRVIEKSVQINNTLYRSTVNNNKWKQSLLVLIITKSGTNEKLQDFGEIVIDSITLLNE